MNDLHEMGRENYTDPGSAKLETPDGRLLAHLQTVRPHHDDVTETDVAAIVTYLRETADFIEEKNLDEHPRAILADEVLTAESENTGEVWRL